ncbi:MAG TPA: hypothetical protein PLD25_21320 [Chloroflexota bacterium]|nr:hypothetical protein [Chloroflexota bacterium]
MKQRLIFIGAILTMIFTLFLSTGQPSPLYGNELAHHPTVQSGAFAPDTPGIQVAPTRIVSQQAVNTQVEHSLTISNTGDTDLAWSIFEASDASQSMSSGGNWVDTFDTYPTGANMHGVGGWKGWENNPIFTAFTNDVRARSAPNSLDIASNSDLVREFSGISSGYWIFTAWQYVPSSMVGSSYFIMLNTYSDNGPKNWSVQVQFDGSANVIRNDGIAGGTATLITDRWVELRLEIDLDQDTQAFYYDDQIFYTAPWSDGVSGNGAVNIAAVDMYAGGASSVYYDDMSLLQSQVCDTPTPIDWVMTDPASGVIPPNAASAVTVTFDTTDLLIGTHRGVLCIQSNDPISPFIPVPLTTRVVRGEPDHELFLPVIVRN